MRVYNIITDICIVLYFSCAHLIHFQVFRSTNNVIGFLVTITQYYIFLHIYLHTFECVCVSELNHYILCALCNFLFGFFFFYLLWTTTHMHTQNDTTQTSAEAAGTYLCICAKLGMFKSSSTPPSSPYKSNGTISENITSRWWMILHRHILLCSNIIMYGIIRIWRSQLVGRIRRIWNESFGRVMSLSCIVVVI